MCEGPKAGKYLGCSQCQETRVGGVNVQGPETQDAVLGGQLPGGAGP